MTNTLMKYQCSRCNISWEGPILECPKCEQTDKISVQTEEKPKDACKSGTWEHDEGFKTEEKPATVPHLRWHRLSELTRDDVGTIELLAATSVDGIGCIARWSRLEDGGWEVSAMDTEGDSGMVPITDFTEEAVPPEPPTMFDDLASTDVAPATVPLAVAEGSPFVRWVREDRLKCWELIVANPRRSAATVWDNGTWHTWDRDGVGGENSSEETVDRAKVEASASAIVQGFI